ncbi:hypothetical protein HMPREF3033_01716 [Veillonellaceae bacterium DNF00751]|nr:hypothetical protein HMPREF3033_01716 [Veillonellaceae bacterium DNF00751]
MSARIIFKIYTVCTSLPLSKPFPIAKLGNVYRSVYPVSYDISYPHRAHKISPFFPHI